MTRRLWSNSILITITKSAHSPRCIQGIHNRQISTVQKRTNETRLRHVLVTGGSRGIGFSIASAFLSTKTHSITLLGRDAARLQEAQEHLCRLHNCQDDVVQTMTADIAQPSIWTEKSHLPPVIDVLVNAAGVAHSSLLSSMSTKGTGSGRAEIEKIIDTNLMGTIYACRAVSKMMLRNKARNPRIDGSTPCIINVSSLLGLQGGKGSSVYAASKAGVLGLTRALAAELGPAGIRVNAIVPGYVDTAMTESMDPIALKSALSRIPLKRFGKPEEIAEAALFLARNEYANNCVINLDGGLSAT